MPLLREGRPHKHETHLYMKGVLVRYIQWLHHIPVGSQIILSQILAIQNSNHRQKHKYLRGKPFLFEGKITGQILNNFTIIKSITIIFVYASQLKKKKISSFSLLLYTQIIFFKGGNSIFSILQYAAHTKT